MSGITDETRSYWDADSATYDDSPGHRPRTAVELAAWSAALRRLLPPPPVRVLDVGAGTGFLSLSLARLGYQVTALDLAPGMLARLVAKAAREGLEVETVEGDAARPPERAFGAVVERHVLWTLPAPAAALDALRAAAPSGRLVLLESTWGEGGQPADRLRSAARGALRRLRRTPPDHHREYDPVLRAQLPLGHGTSPETLVSLVGASSWGPGRIELLPEVDWATRRALPSALDRLIGPPLHFAVLAG